jgi:hypothetical protein
MASTTTASTTTASASNPSTKVAVFQKIKKKFPNLMFFVSKECDFNIVAYDVVRRDQNISKSICKYIRVDLNNDSAETSELPKILQENFYGLFSPKKIGDGVYRTHMFAMPERKLTIKLTKNKSCLYGRIDTIENGRIHTIENALILCVHLFLKFNFGVPELNSLQIIGIDPATRKVIKENVMVTKEMLQKFDVSQIMKSYFLSE